jgi:hypothetical protein
MTTIHYFGVLKLSIGLALSVLALPAVANSPETFPSPQPGTEVEMSSAPATDRIAPSSQPPGNPAPLPIQPDQLNPLDNRNPPVGNPAMMNINRVSDLADVKPSDWAYETLDTLIQRYGAVIGYPDARYRGNRAMSRSEFAAALNQAFPKVDLSVFATQKDLEDLRKLTREFSQELDEIKGRLDRLEKVIQPFSTTTRLNGEVLFSVSGVGDAEKADGRDRRTDRQITLSSRVKLDFLSSVRGKDLLRTALKANNIPAFQRATGTDMARLSYQGDSNNRIELDELSYRTRFGKKARFFVFAAGGSLNKIAPTLNPFLSASGEGSVSRFGQRNPLYRQGGDAGAGFSYDFNDLVNVSVGYVGDGLNNPGVGFGKGGYGAIAQLTFEFSRAAGLGLTYVRSYNALDSNTGSERANDPFAGRSRAVTSDSVGIQTTVALSKRFALSGWAGFTRAHAKDLRDDPSASIFNWAVTLAAPDLGGEGNLLGVVIGQPPKVNSNDFRLRGLAYRDRDTSLHLEAFYRIRVHESISITPGVLIITNPEHNQGNSTIVIGTIRTTFNF